MGEPRRFVVTVGTDGKVRFVYDDDLAFLLRLGESETKRASHVEPSGEEWTADMSPVGGEVLGPFPLRRTALAKEKEWLEERLRKGEIK